jgi:thiamine biosynthesis lipoprotein
MSYANYYQKSNLFHGSALNIMGTRLDVVMIGNESLLSDVWEQIMIETERLHRMLNRFDTASDISIINRNASAHPVELNDELWHILTDIKQYHHQTLGYFDISLRDFNQIIPDEVRRTVRFAGKDISLDLGGYAKGYALERIRKILLQYDVKQALINFGNSSILAVGSHPHEKYWSIGIENPFYPDKLLGICELRNQSLSVSGNTTQRTGHIMNPRLGKFAEERKIVSVVSENAIEAEVLSTALMVADENSILSIKKVFGKVNFNIFVV